MRTTLRLDDRLLREAKRIAAETGRTLAAVIEDLLREALSRRRTQARRKLTGIPTFGSGGLRPGVNLDNTADLLDLMERGDAPD